MPTECPSCRTTVPDRQSSCPSCGRPIAVASRDDAPPTGVAFEPAPDAGDEAVTGFAPLPPAAEAEEAVTGFVATPRVAASSPAPLRSGSAAPGAGRFIPGTLLAGRYRVIGLLGRGGMGEVYRAEDLLLAQDVALKFLPAQLSKDPDRLARFRAEVRTAREVSHPNVCRVYDIGELAGEHFLSMEYIDGEDLASLLRRIGRLPQDKGVEIARQLCAGLAAAHDRGVLHRDLKPANVMIDGRGQVRLADFGLAGVVAEDDSPDLAGTPAYMAPEQFLGRPASVQSDVYALGLVLYEIFTGKPVVSGRTVAELARQHREQRPSSMSGIVAELDPAIDRTIQRCLEKDPADRPASALTVSAGLPGGDPLAEAIARGETPSPELVAAAGDVGFLRPLVALGLVGLVLAGLVAVAILADQVHVVRLTPMPRPPEVLRDRARQMAAALGYPAAPAYTSSGFGYSSYLSYLFLNYQYRPDRIRAGRPAAVIFWYRESPTPLGTLDYLTNGRVTPDSPPPTVPGMLEIDLDSTGRLRGFSAVPARAGAAGTPKATDWSPIFRAMELDASRFTPTTPTRTPPVFADTRAAWSGVYPESPDIHIRVEAASLDGRLVHAEVVEPWTERSEAAAVARHDGFNEIVIPLVFFGLAGGAILLAIRNASLGRGDRRGAFRVGLTLVAVVFVKNLLGADFDGGLGSAMMLVLFTLSRALLFGTFFWVGYLALEPSVRRRWPHTLIAWSRLLAGRWRDPLVARDVLAGCALGVLAAVLFALESRLSSLPATVDAAALDGLRFALSVVGGRVSEATLLSTGILLGLFVLTLLLRRRWIAVALVMVFFGVNNSGNLAYPVQGVIAAGIVGLLLLGLLRLGLLTLIVSVALTNLTESFALTFHGSAWYSPISYLVTGSVLGLTLLALWRATPVRSLVAKLLSE